MAGSLLFFLAGCYDGERETRLIQRERNLLVREKKFALKEAEYQALLKMRDSLMNLRDTTAYVSAWPDHIEGYWNSKVICTESTCPEYVIGDQRNDTWLFSSDSTQKVAKVINNNSLIRVYNGSFNEGHIDLRFNTDSTAARQVTMSVLLNEISLNKIRGTRTVSVGDRCRARFSVELSRTTQ